MHDGSSTPARRVLDATRGAFVDDDGGASIALAADADARDVSLDNVARVIVTFAKPNEGRPYTQARVLRERGFKGRIRAVGAVVVDALLFMQRAGIDEMILRDASDEEFALAALARFSVRYQGDVDDARPLYRRAQR